MSAKLDKLMQDWKFQKEIEEKASAMGWRFPAGLGIAITGGISDSDVTAIGADEVVVNWVYA